MFYTGQFAISAPAVIDIYGQIMNIYETKWKKNSDGRRVNVWSAIVPVVDKYVAHLYVLHSSHLIKEESLAQW